MTPEQLSVDYLSHIILTRAVSFCDSGSDLALIQDTYTVTRPLLDHIHFLLPHIPKPTTNIEVLSSASVHRMLLFQLFMGLLGGVNCEGPVSANRVSMAQVPESIPYGGYGEAMPDPKFGTLKDAIIVLLSAYWFYRPNTLGKGVCSSGAYIFHYLVLLELQSARPRPSKNTLASIFSYSCFARHEKGIAEFLKQLNNLNTFIFAQTGQESGYLENNVDKFHAELRKFIPMVARALPNSLLLQNQLRMQYYMTDTLV